MKRLTHRRRKGLRSGRVGCALAAEVTMPLPFHAPPLRPDWIRPVIPSYTLPVQLPIGEAPE